MSAQVDSVSSWDKRGTDEQKEESFWWVLTSEGGTPAQTHNNPVILINIAFLSFLFLFSVPASCKLCRSLTISSFLLLLLLLSFHAGSSLMDHGPWDHLPLLAPAGSHIDARGSRHTLGSAGPLSPSPTPLHSDLLCSAAHYLALLGPLSHLPDPHTK